MYYSLYMDYLRSDHEVWCEFNNLRYANLTLCHQLLRILKNLVVGSGVRVGKAEKALRNRYVASRQIINSSVLPNELCKKGTWLGPG